MNPLTQPLKPAYFADIERQIRRTIYDLLFAPLLEILAKATSQPAELRNATDDDLIRALHSGRIQYTSGIFSGEFSAAISKALRRLGATFDARSRIYRLDPSRVPAWVTSEATSYQMKAKSIHDALKRKLNEITERLEDLVADHPVSVDKTIDAVNVGFQHIAQELKVSPQLSPEGRAALKREYSENMKLAIHRDVTKFSREEILSLRQRVEQNAQQGYRFDRLIASIKNRYSVTENKAAFLARQETSLFLAKFRERRFKDAGIRRYRWSTAHDARVRHDHRKLNGNVYGYDEPPIVDEATGRRGNPGQDYNCRCVDIPVPEGLER